MRIELQDQDQDWLPARQRPGRLRASAVSDSSDVRLEPQAVDAALADESMPMISERRSRRGLTSGGGSDDARLSIDLRHGAAVGGTNDESSDALLRSLAEQLDLLHEQQRQIRRLLDQAGRLRVDSANS